MNAIIYIVLYIALFSVLISSSYYAITGLYNSDFYNFDPYYFGSDFGSFFGSMLIFILIISIWGIINIIPSLSIQIRRLHDTGKRWYWIFISLIPFVGGILLIVFLATESKLPHENELGFLEQV